MKPAENIVVCSFYVIFRSFSSPLNYSGFIVAREAEVDSLSAWAKMAIQIFVKCVFPIFGTNASFLRVIANLQI